MPRKRPRAFAEFKNIRTLPSGYQVAITRAKVEVTRHFAGHSKQSLAAAVRFRDEVLRGLPNKRLNPIPARVLRAAGVTQPVPGVFRRRDKRAYNVVYKWRGRLRTKQFAFIDRPEAEVYAEAVAYRRDVVERLNR